MTHERYNKLLQPTACRYVARCGGVYSLDGQSELSLAEAIQMKPAALVATLFLSIVAALHLLRFLFQVQFTVASTAIPMWASVLGVLGPGALAVWLWREQRG